MFSSALHIFEAATTTKIIFDRSARTLQTTTISQAKLPDPPLMFMYDHDRTSSREALLGGLLLHTTPHQDHWPQLSVLVRARGRRPCTCQGPRRPSLHAQLKPAVRPPSPHPSTHAAACHRCAMHMWDAAGGHPLPPDALPRAAPRRGPKGRKELRSKEELRAQGGGGAA
mmetsp:Transcript_3047/g.6510  ORF Transcript_3047/g.6510 Transcript_3047/m.6510 type:complete len:170 (-) Transcript_3047:1498-2007(-)